MCICRAGRAQILGLVYQLLFLLSSVWVQPARDTVTLEVVSTSDLVLFIVLLIPAKRNSLGVIMQSTELKFISMRRVFPLTMVAALCFTGTAHARDRDVYNQSYDQSYDQDYNRGYTQNDHRVAGDVYGGSNNRRYPQPRGPEYEYARVVDARPVVEVQRVSHPIEQCYEERVPSNQYSRSGGKQSRTPEIVGAIVGAAVGNQFGGGSGRDIATVAGALLGGSVGRDIKNNARQSRQAYGGGYNRYDVVSRCEVSQSYRSEERIVGYDVSYEYNGHVYQTRMGYDPGDTVRVRVSVHPE